MSTLYYDRWKKYIDHKQAELEGNSEGAKAIDFYAMEKDWANKTGEKYEEKTIKDYVGLANAVYKKAISLTD
ncbi:alpha-N-acetylglucosaminidase C-terminal domain-containing protein [Chitinophagaceae bacterium LB-8]|uniref:Alpha-N-acetylglucosaminidase C-terminal domain-containing protein n=1 Tax=Paraflavisolibacter caeni TaxID=2982496 RepID=A0A9X2Y183_9BACT|nr:alpha-N-acetylglucosaminidase C-terminal domain-containing protein [Paraflavisolibacter caeni]MCU7552632.1 alpha-N-acetylglucosaminidase C-terminal domain-containing protein [Paraflavisolibacter caeni]